MLSCPGIIPILGTQKQSRTHLVKTFLLYLPCQNLSQVAYNTPRSRYSTPWTRELSDYDYSNYSEPSFICTDTDVQTYYLDEQGIFAWNCLVRCAICMQTSHRPSNYLFSAQSHASLTDQINQISKIRPSSNPMKSTTERCIDMMSEASTEQNISMSRLQMSIMNRTGMEHYVHTSSDQSTFFPPSSN